MLPAFFTLARCLNLAWRSLTRPSEALPSAAAGKEPAAELAVLVVIFGSVFAGTGNGFREGSLVAGLNYALAVVVLSGITLFLQVYSIFLTARRLGWKSGNAGDIFNGYCPSWSVSLVAATMSWYPMVAGWPWLVLGISLAAQVWQWTLMVLGVRAVIQRSTVDAIEACLPAIMLVDVPIIMVYILQLMSGQGA